MLVCVKGVLQAFSRIRRLWVPPATHYGKGQGWCMRKQSNIDGEKITRGVQSSNSESCEHPQIWKERVRDLRGKRG